MQAIKTGPRVGGEEQRSPSPIISNSITIAPNKRKSGVFDDGGNGEGSRSKKQNYAEADDDPQDEASSSEEEYDYSTIDHDRSHTSYWVENSSCDTKIGHFPVGVPATFPFPEVTSLAQGESSDGPHPTQRQYHNDGQVASHIQNDEKEPLVSFLYSCLRDDPDAEDSDEDPFRQLGETRAELEWNKLYKEKYVQAYWFADLKPEAENPWETERWMDTWERHITDVEVLEGIVDLLQDDCVIVLRPYDPTFQCPSREPIHCAYPACQYSCPSATPSTSIPRLMGPDQSPPLFPPEDSATMDFQPVPVGHPMVTLESAITRVNLELMSLDERMTLFGRDIEVYRREHGDSPSEYHRSLIRRWFCRECLMGVWFGWEKEGEEGGPLENSSSDVE